MAISDLALRTSSELISEGTSEPDNGNNTFGIAIDRINIDSSDNLEFQFIPQGTSVTDWSFVSYNDAVNPPTVTWSFTQTGTDQVRIICKYLHSIVR